VPMVALGLMTFLGQSIGAQTTGDNSTTTEPETSAGNITTPIAPQGTSLGATGDNSTTTEPETSAGDVSESVAPG
jgi:hypothetical protein